MTKQRANATLVGMAMFLIATTLAAQVTEEWVARYDGPASGFDRAHAMAIDDSGNVYVTGNSEGSGTDWDFATAKYNSSGVEQWVSRYDGPESGLDEARNIAIDDSGNVYVTGVSGYSDDSGTYYDYATVKYNSNGEEQWVARYDGPESDNDAARAITIDADGNVYVTGSSEGSGTSWDYATVKYNSSGVEQWVARYDGPGSGVDRAWAMAIDDAGNVYVTGESKGTGTDSDYATVKYSPSGVEQWVARYESGWACAIAVDEAGNVYVTGSGYTTVKYNSAGTEQWVARYVGDEATAIVVDEAGNVYVTGRGYYDYATVKYNSNGEELWAARYDGPESYEDEANAIAVDGAGNVYVTGMSDFETFHSTPDYATIKYNSDGKEQWIARYDGPESGNDLAYAMAIDDSGNVYVTGESEGSGTSWDYATIKYSQGPGVAEASPDVPGHRLEVAQLTPQPVISYTLPVSTHVSLKVYDVTGKLVRTLVSGSQEAGTHTACWDARNDSNRQVSAGLYFILLETRDFRATGKLVLVR